MQDMAKFVEETYPMSRPKLLVHTARIGARNYRRDRDLPGAVPGLLAQAQELILPKLAAAEAQCERDRRAKSAAYRPGRHVQILAALLAETVAAQANASGSEALRSAT